MFFKKKHKILIIYSSYYSEITNSLLSGVRKVFENENVNYEYQEVPGVFEIPAALAMAVEKNRKKYDGFLTLGCVIRGETSHYDIVAGESARAIMELSVKHKLALGNGILTVNDKEQAVVRASVEKQNRGGWAARAVLQMLEVKKTYG